MIKINLLRPQHFSTTPGEKIMIQAMLENAYRQGIAQGERNMGDTILARLDTHRQTFLECLKANKQDARK